MNLNAAYIMPQSPIFNPKRSSKFESFTIEDSILLRSTLYLNLVDNFLKRESKIDLYFFLDSADKDFIADDFNNYKINLEFVDLKNKDKFFENLSTKEFESHKNNLMISSDLIGVNISELERLNGLMTIEDETLLIGKSKDGALGFLGFNSYSNEVFKSLLKSNFSYDDFLSRIKSSTHFIHTANDVLVIRNLANFKQLYSDLSQKKSIEYCSQEMHERFTHLFIEYKDLLK